MHPFYLEKLYLIRYKDWLRQAEVERLIRTEREPRRAWAIMLGRGLVWLGQTVERFGQPGHISHRHLLHSSNE